MSQQTAVTGKRFSFFRRFDIVAPDGSVYLRRWYLVSTPWFGVYLHHIVQPDPDRDLHDHPWDFVSVVLRGGYTEELPRCRTRHWPAGTMHRMRAEDMHRICYGAPSTWTLLLVGRRRREWGFQTAHRWMPWREYLGLRSAA